MIGDLCDLLHVRQEMIRALDIRIAELEGQVRLNSTKPSERDALASSPDLCLPSGEVSNNMRSRRALDSVCNYIKSHLDGELVLSDLIRISGLSARGLQYAFIQRFERTPMGFVRAERLAMAHSRLTTAKAGDSVMAIAYACGFSNPGAFAASYRKRHGELPSVTLAKAVGETK